MGRSVALITALTILLGISGCTRAKSAVIPPEVEAILQATPVIEATPTPKEEMPTITPTPAPKTPIPTPIPTPSPTPPPVETPTGPIIHIVQPGENLFRIALKYNMSVNAIAAANDIADPNSIYVGQRLIIPIGKIHIVKPGENLFRISLMYGKTVEEIAKANNIAPPYVIYVGQKLYIP
jgi:LysM repeat protein